MKTPKFDYKNYPSEEIEKRAKEIAIEEGGRWGWEAYSHRAHLEYEDWDWERRRK